MIQSTTIPRRIRLHKDTEMVYAKTQPKVHRGPKPGHILHVQKVGNGFKRAYHATKGLRYRRES